MVMLAVDLIFCPPTIPKVYILETHSRVYIDAHGQYVCNAPFVTDIREQCAPEVGSIAAIIGHSSGGEDVGWAAHAPAVTCIAVVHSTMRVPTGGKRGGCDSLVLLGARMLHDGNWRSRRTTLSPESWFMCWTMCSAVVLFPPKPGPRSLDRFTYDSTTVPQVTQGMLRSRSSNIPLRCPPGRSSEHSTGWRCCCPTTTIQHRGVTTLVRRIVLVFRVPPTAAVLLQLNTAYVREYLALRSLDPQYTTS
jgi:hypothetical protein